MFIERGKWLSLAAVSSVPEASDVYDIVVDGELVKSLGPQSIIADSDSWRTRRGHEAELSRTEAPRLRRVLASVEDPLREFLPTWSGTDLPMQEQVRIALESLL